MPLQVWCQDARVGTLSLNDEGRWSFAYDAAWRKFALSPHLPIVAVRADDLVHQRTVEWFFDNLLPEGMLRTRLEKNQALKKGDSWGLLTWYGKDTAGALSVLSDGVAPTAKQKFASLSQDTLIHMIDEASAGNPLMGQDGNPHMSLAGAQDKIGLHRQSNLFLIPEGSTPSTCILKPENVNRAYPFCPSNEWLCMSLAKQSGLIVPDVDLISVGSHRAYVVQRYDRKILDGGYVQRIHQIDLCQAQNVPASKKYEDEGGLTAADLFEVATKCQAPAFANRAAMQWLVFNYLIGNSDAHAKNVSLLISGSKPVVAPAYDLLCVDAYHRQNHLAMAIGGESKATWIEGCHWDALALENGLDPRAMRMILTTVTTNLEKVLKSLLQSALLLPIEQEWLYENVVPLLMERISLIKDALKSKVENAITIQDQNKKIPGEILEKIAIGNSVICKRCKMVPCICGQGGGGTSAAPKKPRIR